MEKQDGLRIVAANIRRLRREHHLTQTELAEAVGLTAGRISQIEGGEVDLPTGKLIEIANALGEPPDMLLRPEKVAMSA